MCQHAGAASTAEASLHSSHEQLFRPAGPQAHRPNFFWKHTCLGIAPKNKSDKKKEDNSCHSQWLPVCNVTGRWHDSRHEKDHMFPLTVSPSLATRSTGSSVNLWMAAVTPMKNVRLAKNLGFSPTAIVTGSAACQAPSAALGGEAEALHHEGLTTTYLSYLLCNSSHVTMCLCPFNFFWQIWQGEPKH